MLKNKSTLYIVLLAIAIIFTDCRCHKRQITIKSVLLEIPSRVSGFAQKSDQEKLSDLIRIAIDKSPYFDFNADDESGQVLRMTLIPPDPNARNSNVLLAATLSSTSDGYEDIKSFVDIRVGDASVRGQDIGQAVSKVLQNLYHQNAGQIASYDIYIEKINASLRGEDIAANELINAAAVLGKARQSKAVMPLIQLLSTTKDLAVGNACLIALSELAAPEAMPAIIDFAERKPAIFRRQAILAARRIGSRLAAEWLLVMAYGHDDPVVRKEAMSALVEVEAKLGINE